LDLNLDKINIINGITNNSPHYALSILYTEEPVHTKCLSFTNW